MRFTNVNPGEHPELIIVGIGRPDKKFGDARISIAYKVIDYIASVSMRSSGCKRQLHSALCDKCMLEGVIVFLAKPTVFANNAGMSVCDILNYYRMRPENLIVVHEDTAIPCGEISLRFGEDVSWHDGLNSVKRYLNTTDFVSVGIGVGAPENIEEMMSFLYTDVPKEEFELIAKSFEKVKKSIMLIMKYGISDTLRVLKSSEASENKNRR